ncbi:T9SS type A sorting domain-containing protein [candidate division WOR-3 bacterium]|nr:T9SS type A sorting domain-containing protein [candidate division WOR-3 bacterium]
MIPKTLCVLCVLCGCMAFAQNYKCDWSVNGIGGGEMAGGNYKCASTLGQTAAGLITGANYWALIGFWQPEEQVGVREAQWSSGQVVKTRLYRPFPNPFAGRVAIRYSLATEARALLQVYDRLGRLVRSWAVSRQPSAVGALSWTGTDDRGRSLANGVYFVRLTAGDYRATEKVVLQK